jgi:hypothetical protein
MARNMPMSTSIRRIWLKSWAPGSRDSSTRTGRRSLSAISSSRQGSGRIYPLRPAEAAHVFSGGHLTTGVAFAFPWHRDVWYSAPAQQLNWWLPVFAVREDYSMSFDLQNFDRPVPNTSNIFDYYQNNAMRLTTATQVTRERQSRPAALDHKPLHDLIVLPAPGAILLFSGAQLHASVPNTSGRALTVSISAPSMRGICWQIEARRCGRPSHREGNTGLP